MFVAPRWKKEALEGPSNNRHIFSIRTINFFTTTEYTVVVTEAPDGVLDGVHCI